MPKRTTLASWGKGRHTPTAAQSGQPDARYDQVPACRDADPRLFFPDMIANGSGQPPAVVRQIDEALSYCAVCPIVAACAEAGQAEEFGIWGGKDEVTRARERRVALGLPSKRAPHGPAKTCKGCGISFTAERSNQEWHDNRCRNRVRRLKLAETQRAQTRYVVKPITNEDSPRMVLARRVRALAAAGYHDAEIAAMFAADRTAEVTGGPWTKSKVRNIRVQYGIPSPWATGANRERKTTTCAAQ